MSWATMLRKTTGSAPILDTELKQPIMTPPIGPTRPPNYRETCFNHRQAKDSANNSVNNTPSLNPTTPPLAPSSGKLAPSAPPPTPVHQEAKKTGNSSNNNSTKTSPKSAKQQEEQNSKKDDDKKKNQNQNNNNNKKGKTSNNKNMPSFTLSPAIPVGTSTHPPALVLTATPTNNNENNNSNKNNKKPRRKIVYSRSLVQNIGKAVVNGEPDVTTVEKIVNICPDIATDACYEILRREQVRREQQFSYECNTCSLFDLGDEAINKGIVKNPPAGACDQMQELIKNSLKDCRSNRGLTFICQSPDVVFSQLRVAVLTDPKRAPRKVKAMPKRCVDKIKTFLCGDGFHFPCPDQTDEKIWNRFSASLKFDKIMDNQTPLFSGLGRFWKKNHTAFEKFVQIMFWRNEAPNPNNFNMVSKNQMPVIVASAGGDIDAAIMLMHLRFYVLQDDYLFSFPFMRTVDPLKASVLRHLNRYFFRKQTERAVAERSLANAAIKSS